MRKFSPEEQFQQSNRIMVEEGAARECLRFVSLSFFFLLPFFFFKLFFSPLSFLHFEWAVIQPLWHGTPA